MNRRQIVPWVPALALALPAGLALACGQGTPSAPTQAPSSSAASTDTPAASVTNTPAGLCRFEYFPSRKGTTWTYAGSTPALGSYERIDTVTEETPDGFVITGKLHEKTLSLHYACSQDGLSLLDPMQSPVTATATGSSGTAELNTLAHSGVSFPTDLQAGLTWRHDLQWEAVGEITISGQYNFESRAVGVETVTVPYGTLDAMHIETSLTGLVAGQDFGECQISTWLAKGIGIVSQMFTCPAMGSGITNSIELTGFTAP